MNKKESIKIFKEVLDGTRKEVKVIYKGVECTLMNTNTVLFLLGNDRTMSGGTTMPNKYKTQYQYCFYLPRGMSFLSEHLTILELQCEDCGIEIKEGEYCDLCESILHTNKPEDETIVDMSEKGIEKLESIMSDGTVIRDMSAMEYNPFN